MVLNRIFIKDFENMVNEFFYSFPTETKPPITIEIAEVGGKRGLSLQMALAGFVEGDIRVWHEDNVLCVSGDNTGNTNVHNRFKMKFERSFSVSKSLDLDKTTVVFNNGLLSITIPAVEKERKTNLLFGRA